MEISLKSFVFTILQGLALILLIFTGPWEKRNTFLFFLQIFGLILWVWSFAFMLFKKSYGLFSEVNRKSQLITRGPFRFIRHPLYSGILIFCLALLLNYFNFLRIFLFLLLLVSTILKLDQEEKILVKHFKDYPDYQKKTKRLIPFVY